MLPWNSFYHTERDGAGNLIENRTATNAKNSFYQHFALNAAYHQGQKFTHNSRAKAEYQKALAAKRSMYTNPNYMAEYKQHMNAAAEESRAAKAAASKRFGGPERFMARGLAGGMIGFQGGLYVGEAAGNLTREALTPYIGEGMAGFVGRGVQVGTSIGSSYYLSKKGAQLANSKMVRDAAGKVYSSDTVKAIRDKIIHLLDGILERLKNNNQVKKVATKLEPIFSKLKKYVTEKAILPLMGKISGMMTKLGLKTAGGLSLGPASIAVFAGVGGLVGALDATNLFQVQDGQTDMLMRTIAAILGAAFNLPYVCMVEIFDLIIVPIVGRGLRQILANALYRLLGSEEAVAELDAKQGDLKKATDAYNEKFNANLDVNAYNDMVNQGVVDDIWKGRVQKDENGNVQFNEDGSVKRGFGISQIPGRVKNEIQYVGKLVDEGVASIRDWNEKESPWGQNHQTFAQWSVEKFVYPIEKTKEIYDGTISSITEWSEKESPWGKEKKSATEWMLDRITFPFKFLDQKLNEYIDKVKNINVTDAIPESVKNAGRTIRDKGSSFVNNVKSTASGIWDSGVEFFSNAMNRRGGGSDETGGVGSLFKNMGDKVSGKVKNVAEQKGASIDTEGGNPLDHPYQVTSPFGMRIHPITGERTGHRGVDIVPTDGDEAQIAARYPGTITAVDYEEGGAGNYVFYDTDNGLTVKFMHMKDGSIPSNIKPGARVNVGDKIGDMGTTGGSTGPHLHYQIEQNGAPVDPMPFIEGGAAVSTIHGGGGGSYGGAGAKKKKYDGPLAQLLGSLQEAGGKFLNKISGGLFGMMHSENGAGLDAQNNPASSTNSFSGLGKGENPQKIYNFLRKKGLSHEAAVGIMANLQQESGMDPSKLQYGGGPGRGIAQWEVGGRFSGLEELAASHGRDWTDLETQLEFLWNELTTDDIDQRMSGRIAAEDTWPQTGYSPLGGGFNEFKSMTDHRYATAAFEAAFERAGTPAMENRFAYADELAATMKQLEEETNQQSGNSNSVGGMGAAAGNKIMDVIKKKKNQGGALDEIFSSLGNGMLQGASRSLSDYVSRKLSGDPQSANYAPYMGTSSEDGGDININDNGTTNVSMQTKQLEALLMKAISELQAINANTGRSSGLLASLNENGIQDKGVRQSIDALGKKSKPVPKRPPYNHNSSRSVNSIIRP